MRDLREYFEEDGRLIHLSASHKPVGPTWAWRKIGLPVSTYYDLVRKGRLRTVGKSKRTSPALIWAAWTAGEL